MTPVTPPANAIAAKTPQATLPEDQGSALSSDFETFLTMLTVQMKNQDPLNPIESSDYALQLATFSGVEQQVKTNDLLKTMGAALRSDGLNAISGWIGREVATVTPAHFDVSPLAVQIDLPAETDTAELQVLNASGSAIDRIPIAKDIKQYEWTGLMPNGATARSGHYSFRAIAYKDGEMISETKAPVYQRVTEVAMTPKGGELILKGGSSILANDVASVRASSS